MKFSMVLGMTVGAVATAMFLSNESKLTRMYRKSRRAMLQKIEDMMGDM